MTSETLERKAKSGRQFAAALIACSLILVLLASTALAQDASAGGGGRRSGITEECNDSVCEVSMTGGAFTAEVLKIRPGAVVAWTSDDKMPHTVTGGSRTDETFVFDSGVLAPSSSGKQWEMKFEKPGTYDYFCQLHKGMAGQIVVGGEPVEDDSRQTFMLLTAAGVFGTIGAVAAFRQKKKG